MGNAWNGAVALLVERIFRQTVVFKLFFIRYALEPNRISGIPDEAEIIRIDSNVKKLVQSFCLFRWEPKPLNQVFCTVHAAAQKLLPEFHG